MDAPQGVIMVAWWWILIAGVTGAMGGVAIMCLCIASKQADEEVDRFLNEAGRF